MLSDESLRALIQLIYEAAVDPDKWPVFLRSWAQTVRAQSAVLVVHDLNGRDAAIEANVGFDPASLRSYRDRYAAPNPWVVRSEHLFWPGTVVNCDSLISVRELKATEFYDDWLRPYDFLHPYGRAITRKAGIVSYVTAVRSERTGPFGEQDLGLLKVIMPHLECAARHLATLEQFRLPTSFLLFSHKEYGILRWESNRNQHQRTTGIVARFFVL